MSVLGISFNSRITAQEYFSSFGPQGGSPLFQHVFDHIAEYESGTGASKVNRIWALPPTAISGATNYDLQGAALLDLNGAAVTFPIVMGLFIKNLSTTSGQYVTVGASTTPWITWLGATGDAVRVGPSGKFELWSPIDGYATTASTGDVLTLTPATGTPSVAMLIVGRSA